MTVGSFFQNIERQKVWDLTFPHMYIDLKMLTPVSVPYSSLRKIQMPFDVAVWIWILIALVVAIFFTYYRIGRSRLTSFFDVINIFLGGPIVQMPDRVSIKFALGMWMLATLVLRNAYQGAMFNFLQAQIRSDAVDTLAKVQSYNYTIYVLPIVFNVLNASMPQLRSQLSIQPSYVCTTSNINSLSVSQFQAKIVRRRLVTFQ